MNFFPQLSGLLQIMNERAARRMNWMPSRDASAKLTPREREAFNLITRGQTNKHAARALGCTERTMKAHRHRVLELEVISLAELVC